MPVSFIDKLWDLFDLKSLVCFCLSLLWSLVDILRMLILPERRQTQFSNKVSSGKIVVIVSTPSYSPCILHQGLSWINIAFVLGVCGESRECNRLELQCGISKQLLHEWQSQGLVIWTWENPGGAGGEETAAAAEPVCRAVSGPRQPSLLLLCEKQQRKQFILYRGEEILTLFSKAHLHRARSPPDLMTAWKVVGVQKTGSSMWDRVGMEAGRKAGMKEWGGDGWVGVGGGVRRKVNEYQTVCFLC